MYGQVIIKPFKGKIHGILSQICALSLSFHLHSTFADSNHLFFKTLVGSLFKLYQCLSGDGFSCCWAWPRGASGAGGLSWAGRGDSQHGLHERPHGTSHLTEPYGAMCHDYVSNNESKTETENENDQLTMYSLAKTSSLLILVKKQHNLVW